MATSATLDIATHSIAAGSLSPSISHAPLWRKHEVATRYTESMSPTPPASVPARATDRPGRLQVRAGRVAWRTLLTTARAGRCPSCLEASMFSGLFTLHPTCPRCAVRYERDSGTFLESLAIGYGIGALWVVALGVLELRTAAIAGIGVDPLWTIGMSQRA